MRTKGIFGTKKVVMVEMQNSCNAPSLHHEKLHDCIRNTTAVCSPRQNSVWEKICQKKKLSEKKYTSDVVLDFQCAKWAVSDKNNVQIIYEVLIEI